MVEPDLCALKTCYTLQGTDMSHLRTLGKGKNIIDSIVPAGKGYVSSQEGISLVISQLHHRCLRETLKVDAAVVYDAASVHDHDWQMHTIMFEKFSKICLIYIYIYTPLKLDIWHSPWKTVVGRLLSYSVLVTFQGRIVKLQGGE